MWDVESTISGRRRTATDRDGSGIRDWNDLEDEQKKGASVCHCLEFSFFSSIQVWMFGKQVSREATED